MPNGAINGVVARWRRGDTSPLKIARTLTQGSLADSSTLGWRTQSLWDCRTTGLSVVPYGNGRAGNIRKALAEILAALDEPSRPGRTPNLGEQLQVKQLANPLLSILGSIRQGEAARNGDGLRFAPHGRSCLLAKTCVPGRPVRRLSRLPHTSPGTLRPALRPPKFRTRHPPDFNLIPI